MSLSYSLINPQITSFSLELHTLTKFNKELKDISELKDGTNPLWICQIGLLYFSIKLILSIFFK